MFNRTLVIVLGSVLIALSTTAVVVLRAYQQEQAELKELQALKEQEEAKSLAATEEQRRAEAERRHVEEILMKFEESKRKQAEIERDIKAQEEKRRTQTAAVPQRSEQPSQQKLDARPKQSRVPETERSKKETTASTKRIEPKGRPADWRGSVEGGAPRLVGGHYSASEIGHRAGREAASLLKRVDYYNPRTNERVRADPIGHNRNVARVRIRTWEDKRLISDTFVRFQRLSSA